MPVPAGMMPRHEEWRRDYRADRYMAHISAAELETRAKDVYMNLLVISRAGKLGVLPTTTSGVQWMIAFTHLLEEFHLRYGPYPNGFTGGFFKRANEFHVLSPSKALTQRAAAAVASQSMGSGAYLVKYGKALHLRPMFEDGVLRVSPASSYSDPSLNHAIRDDELSLSICPDPTKVRLQRVDRVTHTPDGPVVAPTRIEITVTARSNYFVFCLSGLLSARLFLDFGDADSCIIIRQVDPFLDRLHAAFVRQGGNYEQMHGAVRYVDPLRSRLKDVDVFVSKHFRYSYQHEFRVVWVPKVDAAELSPVWLNVGCLRDIGTFVTI